MSAGGWLYEEGPRSGCGPQQHAVTDVTKLPGGAWEKLRQQQLQSIFVVLAATVSFLSPRVFCHSGCALQAVCVDFRRLLLSHFEAREHS